MHKGLFIALEGIGGSGKSTANKVISSIFSHMELPHIVTREPGGTLCAEHIRKLVREGFPGEDDSTAMDPMGVALLFNAARADHVAKVTQPSLG